MDEKSCTGRDGNALTLLTNLNQSKQKSYNLLDTILHIDFFYSDPKYMEVL